MPESTPIINPAEPLASISKPEGAVERAAGSDSAATGPPVSGREAGKGFAGAECDVTEQERLTQELRRREAYLAEAQRLSHTGSFGWKVSTGEILWSEESFQIFQYDQSTKPTLELVLQRVHPEDSYTVQKTIDRALREGKDFEHEYRLLMPDGAVKYLHVVARSLRDEMGSIEFVGAVKDITERKRIELRERSRSRILESLTAGAPLATVLDSIAKAIEVEDPATLCTILLLDDEGKHLLHGAAPSMPRFFVDAVHGMEIGVGVGSCGTAAYTKQRVVAEDLSVHPYWLPYGDLTQKAGLRACWSEPILGANGQVLGTFGIYHRIPRSPSSDDLQRIKYAADFARLAIEFKRAEAGLRASEERFRLISESVADLIAVLDLDGRRVYNSPSYREILGDPEGLHGTASFNEIHPEDREKIRAIFEETVKTGVGQRAEYRFLLKDGRVRYIESQGSVIRDAQGKPVNVVVVSRDVTERRQVHEALRQSEERFREIAESIEEVFWVSDPNHALMLYISPAYERVWGRSRRDLYANPRTTFLESVHPDDRERAMASLEAQKTGQRIDHEYRMVCPNGEVRWIWDRGFPVFDEAGRVVRYVGVGVDISERKHLEGQFRQAQKMEAVGRLAGGVAHDFNNLLTIINGYSELVLDGLDSTDPRRAYLEEIKKAGDRAASLTRQMLAFSRQQVLAPRVLNLNLLVTDVEKMLRRLIGEDIEFVIVRDPALGQVKADPGQIDQILVNLAVNARDAMPQGGKLIIETANVELDDAYAGSHDVVSSGRYVMLAVSDTGIGMNKETLAQIFEPFFTTKEEGKGTGLGLAMVYGTVKQSGGHIWVYSEPGLGTTFKIYLPRVDEAGEPVQNTETENRSVTGSETILLVEDEGAVRALAAKILQQRGYKVLESISPADALQMATRHDAPIVGTHLKT